MHLMLGKMQKWKYNTNIIKFTWKSFQVVGIPDPRLMPHAKPFSLTCPPFSTGSRQLFVKSFGHFWIRQQTLKHTPWEYQLWTNISNLILGFEILRGLLRGEWDWEEALPAERLWNRNAGSRSSPDSCETESSRVEQNREVGFLVTLRTLVECVMAWHKCGRVVE